MWPAVSTFCWIIPRWILLNQKDPRTYSNSNSQFNQKTLVSNIDAYNNASISWLFYKK